jgi:xylulokinase
MKAGNNSERRLFLGVDIGTSSTKGVLVDERGVLIRTAVREHQVERPRPGFVEMDAESWWREFTQIASELTEGLSADGDHIAAVGLSGMGPCTLLTDERGAPLRAAILYGVDSRAGEQINRLNEELGMAAILDRCGSALTSQSVGPKLAWVRENEPEIWSQARRVFMPASWLLYRLTGEYALDHHSASQCTPLYDRHRLEWNTEWSHQIAPGLELPPLRWADERAGTVTRAVAGIPAGTPVITGTIDAWSEAVSAGAQNPGDLMLMYGTTMFLVATIEEAIIEPTMWGTVGAFAGTRNLAGGLATSGAITSWLQELAGGTGYQTLLNEAERSGQGARGLLMLPYFAGERTPLLDPDARGVIAGLSLDHGRGDLYRAALEATAFGVRHNIETMRSAGVDISRVVAVGGGTRSPLWLQIVSDVCGIAQIVPSVTIGASYGAAFLAARLVETVEIEDWNPPRTIVEPDPTMRAAYDESYQLYRALYPATPEIVHSLARREHSRDD